jgi:hypothetical protein
MEVAPDFVDNQCLTRFTDKAIEWMRTKKEKPLFLYLPFTSPHYPVCPLPEFWEPGELRRIRRVRHRNGSSCRPDLGILERGWDLR